MVSVCLPFDALLQHLLSYLGFSYLGHGVRETQLLHLAAPAKPLLLTLDEEYLLTAAPPDLERGVTPLGPPVPAHPNKKENQYAISKWQKCNKNGKKLVPESIHLVIVLSCGQMAIGQNVSDFT